MNHQHNLMIAFNVDLDGLTEMLADINENGKILIRQDPNHQEIHYIMTTKSKYKQGTLIKLLKKVRYYNHELNYAICNVEDVKKTKLPPKPVKNKLVIMGSSRKRR